MNTNLAIWIILRLLWDLVFFNKFIRKSTYEFPTFNVSWCTWKLFVLVFTWSHWKNKYITCSGIDPRQKYSRLRCLLRVKGLVFCFYLGWSGSILQFRQNIIKVGSKSWLLTCSSNITLSLPSYTGSALKRELNFCNGYLSLLYFWTHLLNNVTQLWMDSRGRLLKMTKYGMCRIWGFCQHTCSGRRQCPLLGLLSEPLPTLGASYQTRSPKYL